MVIYHLFAQLQFRQVNIPYAAADSTRASKLHILKQI